MRTGRNILDTQNAIYFGCVLYPQIVNIFSAFHCLHEFDASFVSHQHRTSDDLHILGIRVLFLCGNFCFARPKQWQRHHTKHTIFGKVRTKSCALNKIIQHHNSISERARLRTSSSEYITGVPERTGALHNSLALPYFYDSWLE